MWNFRRDALQKFSVRYDKSQSSAFPLGLGDSSLTVKSYQPGNTHELKSRAWPNSESKSPETKLI